MFPLLLVFRALQVLGEMPKRALLANFAQFGALQSSNYSYVLLMYTSGSIFAASVCIYINIRWFCFVVRAMLPINS